MSLSKEDVLKVARLARIELTDQEVEKFQVQLSDVISYIDQLKEINTEGHAEVT